MTTPGRVNIHWVAIAADVAFQVESVFVAPANAQGTFGGKARYDKLMPLFDHLELACQGNGFFAFVGIMAGRPDGRNHQELVVIRWDTDFQPPMIAVLDDYAKHGIRCGADRVGLPIVENYPNSVFSIRPFRVSNVLTSLPVEKTTTSTYAPVPEDFRGLDFRDDSKTIAFGLGAATRRPQFSLRELSKLESCRGLWHWRLAQLKLYAGPVEYRSLLIENTGHLEAAD